MTNEHWLITGASSGLGRALAEAVLIDGGTVVTGVRRPERAADLVAAYPETFAALPLDVRDTGAAAGFVTDAEAAYGPIDVLVNNAGIGRIGAAEEVSDEDLRDMLAQHLFGPAALVRAVLPGMRERRRGSIVQLSSQGGRRSFAGAGSYSAGKFALEGWSEALAQEVAPFGIRVLLVEPSRFRTGFNAPDVLSVAAGSEAYADVLGPIRTAMAEADGVQEGDPVRGAKVILEVLARDDAPLRLPLGADAVGNIGDAYRTGLADLERFADLARSADFPAADPATAI